jgi:SNF2 family DNA or RNA helicase
MELYAFQQTCIDKFLPVNAALCGDDMGLGKTVEAIVLDAEKRTKYGPEFVQRGKMMTLVITPKSVFSGWQDHLKEWAPDLKVVTIDPKNREIFLYAVKKAKADVYILHWEGLRLIREELQKIHWFHIVADEVHRAKNRDAQQTLALKSLSAEHKLGLSGTPADNSPVDFWSIANWLWPKEFSSFWAYNNEYLIWKHHNTGYCDAVGCAETAVFHKRGYKELVGIENVDKLHAKFEPFYIRRTKKDEGVLDDLPLKYYTDIAVDLHPQQRRTYSQMRDKMLTWIGKHEDQPFAAPIVIAQLIRLQQFACAYGEIETVIKRYRKCEECTEDGLPRCKGHEVQKLKLIEPSSKLDVVMEMVDDNPSKQFVVFGQSKQVVNMLAARLDKAKVPVAILTSDTKDDDRPRLIREFQAGERRVFAGTIKAGGEGITLTAASTVIFLDLAWSPSKNRQAEDRLHRIGQKDAVQVIRLIANDTIDASRNEQIELKWTWLKKLLGDE